MIQKMTHQKWHKQKEIITYLHGASAFQILNAGFELKIFEILNKKTKTYEELKKVTNLSDNSLKSLLQSLKALNLIKEGYSNTKIIKRLFEKNIFTLIKKMCKIQSEIMYLGQKDYINSLKKNKNIGVKRYNGKGDTIYEKLNQNKELKKIFYDYMEEYSKYALPFMINHLNLKKNDKVLDIGGGGGHNAKLISNKFKASVTVFDLEHVKDLVNKKNISFHKGDMFKNSWPKNQDCIMFIHQLVIWSEKENEILLKKAYNSLKKDGKIIIFSSISNNDLMSGLDNVYFKAVAAGSGRIYSFKEYETLLKKIGFKIHKKISCKTWTPHGLIIAKK